jgi:hypothetical protein
MTLSIRNILVGIFLLLSAVICVLTASSAMDAYNKHQVFGDVSKLTALDRALFQTLATFRNERGDGSSAANMEIDALAGTLASLKKDRGLVDSAMASAKAICTGTTAIVSRKVFFTERVKLMSVTMRSALASDGAPLSDTASQIVCTSGTTNSSARKATDGRISR